MAAVAASSSSRLRAQDAVHDAYDLRTYLKRKTTDRRSPRSSEEKLYAPESAKQPRSGAYTRGGYPTTSSMPQGTSQSYYAANPPPSRDPVIPQRDRDREKAEARERKRSEKEAAKARIEEEKSRVRAYERERERAGYGMDDYGRYGRMGQNFEAGMGAGLNSAGFGYGGRY